MPSNSPQPTNPIDSRLARQLIASAPEEAQQLSDELGGQSWSEMDISWLQDELAKKLGYVILTGHALLSATSHMRPSICMA